jgi:pyruvate dehydrogenase E1 component
MPDGAEEGILRGMHRVADGGDDAQLQLLGSGTILREVLAGADLLNDQFGVAADVWSVTSFTELARDGIDAERRNRLRGAGARSYVEQCLAGRPGPAVAATDYVRAFAEQIRPWIGREYTVLGTDGFGRSDWRTALRRFFEVDRHHVVVAALRALGRDDDAEKAIATYEIDADAEAPWRR